MTLPHDTSPGDDLVGRSGTPSKRAERSVFRRTIGELLRRPPRPHRRPALWLSALWLGLVVCAVLFAPVLHLPSDSRILGAPNQGPGHQLLGTDYLGRSELSRLVFGARPTILVGLGVVAIGMTFGTLLGVISGYMRGKTDQMVNVLLDALLSVPAVVILLALVAVGQSGPFRLTIWMGLILAPTFARLARVHTLAQAALGHVTASKAMGATRRRIIARELLPTVVARVSPVAFLVMALSVVVLGTLGFLGVGLSSTTPTWGGMINDARPYLQQHPWQVMLPDTCLFLTIISFTIIGDRVRLRIDSRYSMQS